ncbi:unnamed protein product [Parnassius mnemosyne]|uniref:DUF5641 domain-containing protein n=1 Tax=Parnassius mnemosyne TaxID=213953 RepID=A0AAV1KD05_9NEOP
MTSGRQSPQSPVTTVAGKQPKRREYKISKLNAIKSVKIVLFNLSPLYWPLARVINTYPGKDGKVRVVEVKTANGHKHKRAVMKVCVLPLECSGAG